MNPRLILFGLLWALLAGCIIDSSPAPSVDQNSTDQNSTAEITLIPAKTTYDSNDSLVEAAFTNNSSKNIIWYGFVDGYSSDRLSFRVMDWSLGCPVDFPTDLDWNNAYVMECGGARGCPAVSEDNAVQVPPAPRFIAPEQSDSTRFPLRFLPKRPACIEVSSVFGRICENGNSWWGCMDRVISPRIEVR